jgi:transposase-like protein
MTSIDTSIRLLGAERNDLAAKIADLTGRVSAIDDALTADLAPAAKAAETAPPPGKRRRRLYTPEFKARAVTAAKERTAAVAAREIGIHVTMIRRWAREHDTAATPAPLKPGGPDPMPAITSIPDPRPPAETPGLAAASTTSAVSRLRDQLANGKPDAQWVPSGVHQTPDVDKARRDAYA